ncbi:Asp-tRNA(Asn)/Glu-tRNA(Gln) amidotransferase subunit GatB [Fabibacter sp. E12]|nr:Asp-tRNA(Asn)/Glu-tRNA(Gln) amidotransferase subunit GatB [Roseivirga sp. E12]
MTKLTKAGFQTVVGLEVHVQLNTASKIFSSDPNTSDAAPNENISVISLGHPGTLPVLNKEVVEKSILMGLACGSEITRVNHFARKSYFYPDLPKGYQTTQDKTPICMGGTVELFGEDFQQPRVELHHIHMEEDAGKSIHDEEGSTLIDLNRAGTPLIEIVTNPSIKGPDEAAAFLQEIRRIVRFLGISEANMENGELRCDANISIMPIGATVLGNKVEVKNMNSFGNVRKAITHELERQLEMALSDQYIDIETRTFDPSTGKTASMRFKETMNDYRYFPCPDLPPVVIDDPYLELLRSNMAQAPQAFRKLFKTEYQLSDYDVSLLTEERETALYFHALCELVANKKTAANWLNGAVKGLLNEKDLTIDQLGISAERMAGLIDLLAEGRLNNTVATHTVLPAMLENDLSALHIAESQDLLSVDNADTLEDMVNDVLLSLPKEVEAFKQGKKKLMGLFMGQVMKKSQGKADAKQVQEILNKKLNG